MIVENFGMLHLDPEITFYLRTLSMQMTPRSQLIFDKLVYDLCRFFAICSQIYSLNNVI